MEIIKIRIPFLRFFINWSLLLSGLYLTLTGIYWSNEQTRILISSFPNNEILLAKVEYENSGRFENYIVHVNNLEDHYLLGTNTDHEVLSPNNEFIVFTDNNRLRITNTLTTDISTIALPQNITLELYIPNPVWSQDSQWIALLDHDRFNTCWANLIIVNANELESHNLGRIRPCDNTTRLRENEGLVWSENNQYVFFHFTNGEYNSIFTGDVVNETNIIDSDDEGEDDIVVELEPIQLTEDERLALETSILNKGEIIGNIFIGFIAICLAFGVSYHSDSNYWKREIMRPLSSKYKNIG